MRDAGVAISSWRDMGTCFFGKGSLLASIFIGNAAFSVFGIGGSSTFAENSFYIKYWLL